MLCCTWVVYTAFQGPFALKRSTPGRMARWVAGKGALAQSVDNLADELSQPATATALRSWAAATLAAQRKREVVPADIRYPDSFPCIEAADVAPPSVFANYTTIFAGITPVTHLHVDQKGRVDAAMLSWANMRVGLIVIPSGQAPIVEVPYMNGGRHTTSRYSARTHESHGLTKALQATAGCSDISAQMSKGLRANY